jgi:hypothetical protein
MIDPVRLPSPPQRGQIEAGERHAQHGVDAPRRILGDRVLRDGQHDDRDRRICPTYLLGDLAAGDASLKQGIHDQDVGAELTDSCQSALAGGHHLEHLDLGLGLQQRAHVRCDLRHVLDNQEPDLLGQPSPLAVVDGRFGSSDDEDAALAVGLEAIEVVRAICMLDGHPRLRHDPGQRFR